MLAHRPSPRQAMERHDTVVFALRGKRFAVAPGQIIEIVRIDSYTPLPCEDTTNLGVVLHRDRVIPLVDLRPGLGIRGGGPLSLPMLCVFALGNLGEVAFPVDQVLGLASSTGERLADDVAFLDLDQLGDRHVESAAD